MSVFRLLSKVRSGAAPAPAAPSDPTPPRTLFLDDDPARAEIFLSERPHAVWVQTVAECVARLVEGWDEVHLDHDLGGEQFVDLSREDCGMEVVRWLCLEPRTHLESTRFYVHSHNPTAAAVMGMQLMMNGYHVEVRPFGAPQPTPLQTAPDEPDAYTDVPASLPQSLGTWLRGVWERIQGKVPTTFGYGYTATRGGPVAEADADADAAGADPSLNFDWVAPARAARRAEDQSKQAGPVLPPTDGGGLPDDAT